MNASEEELARAALFLLQARVALLAEIDAGLADFETGNYTSYELGEHDRFLSDIKDESARL